MTVSILCELQEALREPGTPGPGPGLATSFWAQLPLASAALFGKQEVGGVGLQGGPPGKFCDLTTQGDLNRTRQLGHGALDAQHGGRWPTSLTSGVGACGKLFPPLLHLVEPGRSLQCSMKLPGSSSPYWLCTRPRKATTSSIAGSGWIRELSLQCPVPRSRDLHPPSGRTSHQCPCIQTAVTEAIGVSTEQTGCVTIPLGTKVTAPLSV